MELDDIANYKVIEVPVSRNLEESFVSEVVVRKNHLKLSGFGVEDDLL